MESKPKRKAETSRIKARMKLGKHYRERLDDDQYLEEIEREYRKNLLGEDMFEDIPFLKLRISYTLWGLIGLLVGVLVLALALLITSFLN